MFYAENKKRGAWMSCHSVRLSCISFLYTCHRGLSHTVATSLEESLTIKIHGWLVVGCYACCDVLDVFNHFLHNRYPFLLFSFFVNNCGLFSFLFTHFNLFVHWDSLCQYGSNYQNYHSCNHNLFTFLLNWGVPRWGSLFLLSFYLFTFNSGAKVQPFC